MIDRRVHTPRLLWVKNGSGGASKLCLRYTTKQTSTTATATVRFVPGADSCIAANDARSCNTLLDQLVG